MRVLRKLMLLAVSAIAALAFAAPAQATDTVQVINEDTGASCGSLACNVHIVGSFELRVNLGFLGEVHEASCNFEMEMRIGGSGGMAIDGTEHNTGPDANCGTVVTECKLPWTGKGEEDGPVGVVQSSVAVCLDPSESSSNCEGSLTFLLVEEIFSSEHYSLREHAHVGVCDLDLDLEIEHSAAGNTEIHVNHP